MAIITKTLEELEPITQEALDRIKNLRDEDIDYSDIPELDENFWKNAKVFKPKISKSSVALRLDAEVLEWFKAQGEGYTTHMASVLQHYYEHQK